MENTENTEVKDNWFVRGDEKMFNEWKALQLDIGNCAGIVQNDMEFCKEMLFDHNTRVEDLIGKIIDLNNRINIHILSET